MTGEADFVTVAMSHGLLATDDGPELREVSRKRGVAPAQAARDSGVMSAEAVDTVEMLLSPREIVPGYELQSILGMGGMGVVFYARQLSFDRMVALKMVRTGGGVAAGLLSRFETEAKTIGRLVHPQIVTAFDFVKHRERLFLAMEYVDGQDAERYTTQFGPLSDFLAWSIVRQAANGLSFALKHGVIHRDVKPANLLLYTVATTSTSIVPHVKVADFGLALLRRDNDETTQLTIDAAAVGSPHYMAPEQLESGLVNERADLYALGATALHLLTGEKPFANQSTARIVATKLGGGGPALNEHPLSAPTRALLEDLLRPKPEDRLGDYRELIGRIDQILETAVVADRSAVILSGSQLVGGPSVRQARSATSLQFATETDPVIESHPLGGKTVPNRRRLPLWVSLATGAAVVTGAVWGYSQLRGVPAEDGLASRQPTSQETWSLTGRGGPSFDGETLTGWRVQSGSWLPARDDEQGRVLAGSGGSIAYPVSFAASAPGLTPGYRLTLLARRNSASGIEVQFGDVTNASGGAIEFAVRIDETHVRLIRRMIGSAASVSPPVSELLGEQLLGPAADRGVEIIVESWPGWRRVLVDEQLLASVRVTEPKAPSEVVGSNATKSPPKLAEFRLSVDRAAAGKPGTAWFADLVLEELRPPAGATRPITPQ